jgi:hypothetical protein
MCISRGLIKEDFGPCGHVGVEEEVSNFFTQRRATRLSGTYDLRPRVPQFEPFADGLDESGLAGTFGALECN